MNEWIKINDKKPIETGYYICFSPFTKKVCLRFFNKTDDHFFINGDRDKRVTHWMDLPSKPE